MKWINNRKLQVLADQLVFSGSSFLLTILIAKYISVADFGLYSTYLLMFYLGISGIGAWTIQVFQVKADQNPEYFSFVFWAQTILLVLCAVLLETFNQFFKFNVPASATLFGVGFILYDFARKLLLTNGKIFTILLIDILTSLLSIAAFLFFKYSGSKDVHQLISYFAGVYGVTFILFIFRVRPFSLDLTTWKQHVKIHFREGKWLFLTAVSQWWSGNLFVVASGIYLGIAALGALRLAQSIFGVLNVLLQTYENYVLPKTAQKMKTGYIHGASYLKEVNQKLAYIFLPFLAGTFFFSKYIFNFIGGPAYAEYAFVLKGLSVLYIFILLSQPVRFVFRALQINHHFFYAYLLSLGFALISSHGLISSFGLNGVIAGLIGSQIILLLYLTLILQSKNINLWKSFISY